MASNITLQHKAPIATTSLRALVKSTKKSRNISIRVVTAILFQHTR